MKNFKIKYSLPCLILFLILGSDAAFATGTINTDSTEIYTVVDTMPEIIGGIEAVYTAIDYPKEALEKKIQGRVFIKFVIDEKGEVRNPVVLKDIGAGCGEAAVEGIKNVSFSPGLLNGEPVKVYFSLPVTFKMAD